MEDTLIELYRYDFESYDFVGTWGEYKVTPPGGTPGSYNIIYDEEKGQHVVRTVANDSNPYYIRLLNAVYFHLSPGKKYIVKAEYKTFPTGRGYVSLCDMNWTTAGGIPTHKNYYNFPEGSNQWEVQTYEVEIPLVDDSGESVANHDYRFYLYSHLSWDIDENSPVYWNYIAIYEEHVKDMTIGRRTEDYIETKFITIDFGDLQGDPLLNPSISNASYTESAAGEPKTEVIYYDDPSAGPSQEELVKFRTIKGNNYLYVYFDSGNFSIDADGIPIEFLVLEIRYKDDFGYSSTIYPSVNSVINMNAHTDKGELDPFLWYGHEIGQEVREQAQIANLGQNDDDTWKCKTILLGCDSRFPLSRSINGQFSFCFYMSSVSYKIDYVSLKAVSESYVNDYLKTERFVNNFYLAQLPPDRPVENPSEPISNPSVENLLIFMRDNDRMIREDTRPQLEEINNTLNIFGTKGELLVTSFGIYSGMGINDLEISAKQLTGAKKIDPDYIELFEVICDYKRLTTYDYVLTNDHYCAKIPDRIEKFTQISINSNSSKRIWIYIRIPVNFSAGNYSGEITIKKNGELLDSVSINLEVVDIELQSSDILNDVWVDPFYQVYATVTNDVHKLYRDTQLTPFVRSFYRGVEAIEDSNGIVVDFFTYYLERNIDELIKQGTVQDKITIDIFHMVHYLCFNNFGFTVWGISNYSIYTDLSRSDVRDAIRLLIRKLKNIASERSIQIIFFVRDEPGINIHSRIVCDRIFTYVKEEGEETMATYYPVCDLPLDAGIYTGVPNNTIPPLTDLVDYKVFSVSGIKTGYESFQDSAYYGFLGDYTTIFSYLRILTYNRFAHGIQAYVLGSSYTHVYTNTGWTGDPWNDFDIGSYWKFPSWLLGSPTWDDGYITLMNAEGIKEGITDYRYIKTLEYLIDTYPDVDESKEGEIFLKGLKENIDYNTGIMFGKEGTLGFYPSILETVSTSTQDTVDNVYDDFEAFSRIREKVKDFIVAILEAGPPVPPPVPTIVHFYKKIADLIDSMQSKGDTIVELLSSIDKSLANSDISNLNLDKLYFHYVLIQTQARQSDEHHQYSNEILEFVKNLQESIIEQFVSLDNFFKTYKIKVYPVFAAICEAVGYPIPSGYIIYPKSIS